LMNTPADSTTPTAPEPNPKDSPSTALKLLGRLGWAVVWIAGASVALLLACAVAFWLWAGTQDSLARTLGWAQSWMEGRPTGESVGTLQTEGVEGSLRGGGKIASLSWAQGELDVQARSVELDWNDALWMDALMGRGVHLASIKMGTLSVRDQRAPTPSEPMESLTLPIPVSLAFEVGAVELSGNTELKLSDLRGMYEYGPQLLGSESVPANGIDPLATTHRLRLDSLRLADGYYKAKLNLEGQAPMALNLDLQGDVSTQIPDGPLVKLTAQAQARGTLAGPDATLEVTAQAEGTPQTPGAEPSQLSLKARVKPWAKQPVVTAEATARALNLAALWPGAPATDLSGQLQAQPDGEAWRATVQLENSLVAPADQKGLPLQSLQAEVEQRGDQWTIASLMAKAGGGNLQGQGSFRLDTQGETTAVRDWQGEVKATGIRPALLWSELAKGALDSNVTARAAPTDRSPQAVALQAQIKPSAQQPKDAELTGLQLREVKLRALWQPGLAASVASSGGGLLDLQEAKVIMAGAQLEAKGQLDASHLNYDGQLNLTLPGTQLSVNGLAAHAKGQGRIDLQIDSAERLLAWVRGLQKLPWVGPQIQTALAGQANLSVEGSLKSQWQWTGGLGALGFPAPGGGTSPTGSTAKAAWPELNGSLTIPRLSVRAGEAPATVLDGISLQAEGPLSAMRISAKGNASAPPWRVTLDSKGQLKADASTPSTGQLQLDRLALALTPIPADTEKPVQGNGWRLENAQPLQIRWTSDAQKGLAIDAGTGELHLRPATATPALETPLIVAWQKIVWQAQALETQGRLQGLSLPWIEALAAAGQPAAQAETGVLSQNNLSGDLVFDGAWNVRIPADTSTPLELSATLQRRSGDLRWLASSGTTTTGTGTETATNGTVVAGVKDGRISLTVRDRQVEAQLRWDTERLGQAKVDFQTQLNPKGTNEDADLIDRWWPANTPIQGNAQARLPQVGVWSMFAPPGWRMSGTLSADATISGTRAKPEWRGNLQADELALRSVVDGFAFTNGVLRATIVGERIQVDRFSLQGPGGASQGGTLEATGQAEWRAVPGSLARQPFIELKARAERLRVSNRVDRRLTLSGDVTARLVGPKLQLRGDLTTDAATFILPDELAPSLSKDVIVRSTRTLPTEAEDGQRVQPDVSVSLDLGSAFEVRGQGIQTRLEGKITVRATPSLPTPRAFGEVRTVSGTYKAYGQQLNIETGVLRFNGPYDDPALDILAVRKLPEGTDQRVGVQITGNVQAPRVGLFADPDLPDGDKLAWLVLGKPASASGAQAFVLQQAARKLLSRGGEPMDSDLAKTLGLDEIGFAGPGTNTDGTTTEAALSVGKRLSKDLYLSYEQSLAGAVSTVSILYDLSKSLTLRARAGTENAVDVIFTHRYE
jgi:translocation and assembly module TamB